MSFAVPGVGVRFNYSYFLLGRQQRPSLKLCLNNQISHEIGFLALRVNSDLKFEFLSLENICRKNPEIRLIHFKRSKPSYMITVQILKGNCNYWLLFLRNRHSSIHCWPRRQVPNKTSTFLLHSCAILANLRSSILAILVSRKCRRRETAKARHQTVALLRQQRCGRDSQCRHPTPLRIRPLVPPHVPQSY